MKSNMSRGIRFLVVCALLGTSSLLATGCGGKPENANQVPDNPAPLPDPAERVEG